MKNLAFFTFDPKCWTTALNLFSYNGDFFSEWRKYKVTENHALT